MRDTASPQPTVSHRTMTTLCRRLASSPGFLEAAKRELQGGGAAGPDTIVERLAVMRDSLADIEAELRNRGVERRPGQPDFR